MTFGAIEGMFWINTRFWWVRLSSEADGMHDLIERRRDVVSALCREYGVARLDLFGSAARGTDFDRATSDADFLVSFERGHRENLAAFADFKDALEAALGIPVDLVDREAVENSRNFIRRRRILAEAQTVHG